MCCEQLICARCTAPVAEARCPSCRAARAQLHPMTSTATLQAVVVLAVLALLFLAIAVHAQLG